jgi:hypothetical protein
MLTAEQSQFGKCQIDHAPMGLQVRLTKTTQLAARVA